MLGPPSPPSPDTPVPAPITPSRGVAISCPLKHRSSAYSFDDPPPNRPVKLPPSKSPHTSTSHPSNRIPAPITPSTGVANGCPLKHRLIRCCSFHPPWNRPEKQVGKKVGTRSSTLEKIRVPGGCAFLPLELSATRPPRGGGFFVAQTLDGWCRARFGAIVITVFRGALPGRSPLPLATYTQARGPVEAKMKGSKPA